MKAVWRKLVQWWRVRELKKHAQVPAPPYPLADWSELPPERWPRGYVPKKPKPSGH